MKKFLEEFKKFISRGNVIDMAVGIIIGSAFTAIVNSLVKDVIMPALGFLINGIDFNSYKFVLMAAEGEKAEVSILYGSFLQQTLNFIIIAFVVFCMTKAINRITHAAMAAEIAKAEAEAAAKAAEEAAKVTDIDLLTEIRDLLKK